MTSLDTLADGALIEGTLAGDSDCFAVLMRRHTAAVRRRVRSMVKNTWDQDDLVQETFLKAWRNLSSFRSDASFRTWISRVAVNEVLQRHRKDRSNPAGPAAPEADRCPSQEESPHEAMERVETRRTIREAVGTLPQKYREVIVLRDLHELTLQEAAESLQSGIPLVKTRLFRARQMLSAVVLGRRAA